ncbi:RETRotransposon-like family member [Reticulomyxa filosa]|uniref:RETRotransposon-like family member n=1 Tax=Reticulomyxa filosa TaxID=46433 RepID=X6LMN9_RETFI|nr:RETRotransposon-like family member [Reticulomyxa filosa]|eukprot:ETO03213.1 RETRotransposon-like family member [Reticulomyxa filosa]
MASLFDDMDDVDVYIDGILISNDSEEYHLKVLTEVFCRFSKYNLKLAIDKCEFFLKRNYISWTCNIRKMHISNSIYIKKILNVPKPKTKKQLEKLIGLTAELSKLRRKNSKCVWNDVHEKAFGKLKMAIAQAQVLRHPKQNEPLIVHCDASNEAVGAALLQNHDGILAPIEFISKQFDIHQLNWHTSEKDFMRKQVNSRLARWAIQLSEFSFEAKYFPGNENFIADFLSRNPKSLESAERLLVITRSHSDKNMKVTYYNQKQNSSSSNITYQIEKAFSNRIEIFDYDGLFETSKFCEAQRTDKDIEIIIKLLKERNKTNQHSIDDIPIKWRNSFTKGKIEVNKIGVLTFNNKPIVPKLIRSDVMRYFHCHAFAQHQGTQRMLATIRERLYWPGITNDVKTFCRNCFTCQIAKGSHDANLCEIQHFHASRPFQMVALDIVGPLPKTDSGYEYILTMMNRFTRWVTTIPLRTHTSNKIAQLTSQVLGMKQLFTSTYHPQTNGMLERFYRYLKERLVTIVVDRNLDFISEDSWELFLHCIVTSYNITPNTVD